MITNKAKHDMDWRAIEDISITTYETMDSEVSKPIILSNSCTLEPPHRVGVVIQTYKPMYLRESFMAILEKHETHPIDHNEALSDFDVAPL